LKLCAVDFTPERTDVCDPSLAPIALLQPRDERSEMSEDLPGKTKCVAAVFHPPAKGGKIQTAILGVMLVLRRDYDRVFRNKTRTDKTQRSGWLRRETD